MRLGWMYTLAGLGLLAIVLVLGSEVFGAKNWLSIKGITFQPSEFVKLTFILAMAALLIREAESKYRNLLLVSVVAALHVGLLALSNDFGGALIFFTVYLLMLFVVSADFLFPTAAVLSGSLAAVLAYRYSGHIRERVLAWQNPFSCIENEGYQIAQSLFAIGNGEWVGTGLYGGMPKTIPVVKSDFIFAGISEEFGAIFAALLLCVYINCIIWMMALALERKQPFLFAVTTGAVALFGVQLFLNVGGVIRLIPSTGVTFGFISYGGSSLFSSIFLFQGIQAMRGEEKSKAKGKKEWNYTGQQIRMIVVCAMTLLLLCTMMAYFLTVTVGEAKESYYNEYNRRIKATEQSVLKGKILAADGTILARSIRGEDGKIYRLYPHGEEAAFITGQMLAGCTGLEKSFWQELYEADVTLSEKIKIQLSGEEPERNSVVTTIDMKLQQIAYEELKAYKGAIGVLEVKTGRLLAFVSTPSYNPNELISGWEELNTRTDAPLMNRLTHGLYPPGSTFKVVMTYAWLQNHQAEEFAYTCNGTARFRNTTIHCNNNKAHGTQTLKDALANSCNTAFAYMGEILSEEELLNAADNLGFGTILEHTLPYLASEFPLTEEISEAAKVQGCFGQGEVLMTPYHKLMLVSAIANGGTLKLPYLTERLENYRGDTVVWYGSGGEKQMLSEEISKILTEYMVAASEPLMWEFAQKGIQVAGKTGSAESPAGTHSWYMCFAPAQNPEIAMVVLVEGVGNGSRYAVPAAKEILNAYFME